ncbi:hypothetical protein AAG570_000065 [Ranatra chinensis]|uniref:Uncharacterized protein n=1 Tax=Ranatra chinensis TaxID=642074 RepID=A0ABD0YW09_9HEMI
MASKRRNMFHKNKTQETTEKGIRKVGGAVDRVSVGQEGSLKKGVGCNRHHQQFSTSLGPAKKQFSLSKEHLKSVSLVRETLLSRQRTAFSKAAAAAAAAATGGQGGAPKAAPRPRPQPRKKEWPLGRLRRDSEQSDDSVLRADEEVRAYMYNENKVPPPSLMSFSASAWWPDDPSFSSCTMESALILGVG